MLRGTDRDRFDAGGTQLGDGLLQRVLVNRRANVAVVIHALGNFFAEMTWDERRWFFFVKIVERGARLSSDFQQVFEPSRDEQPGFRSLFLDKRVRRDGRAVPEIIYEIEIHLFAREQFGDAGHNRAGWIRRRRKNFGSRRAVPRHPRA